MEADFAYITILLLLLILMSSLTPVRATQMQNEASRFLSSVSTFASLIRHCARSQQLWAGAGGHHFCHGRLTAPRTVASALDAMSMSVKMLMHM